MKNKITYLPIGILTLTTALAGVSLSSTGVAADTSGSKAATVTVGSSCTFTGTTSYSATVAVYAGNTSESDTSRSPYSISCNNPSGFVVQAIGFSPDSTHPAGLDGNTAMYNSESGTTISTGTSGPDSYWGFRIGFAYATAGTATIETGYNAYAAVPSSATDVISFSGSTASVVTGLFRPDYQVYAAPSLTAGSYSGAVKYTLVPNS
ncbi:hypothetical protein IKF84_02545 [Candidatus Saccharibacteria bacterium]|nr:hypothetical protein [Candidatus Saccharibacteria bacterium]